MSALSTMPTAPARISGPERRRRSRPGSSPGEARNIGYLFVAPALVLYGLFVLVPFVHTIYLSFFTWDGIGRVRDTFVGVPHLGWL